MRLRLAVPASLLAAVVAVAIPTAVSAAPHHNHGLTINATPNPSVTGDPVLIYGQLNLPHPANRLIVLYHRINPDKHFSIIQTTRTDPTGFYEFSRADGIVTTNRSWFVKGPKGTHSRTIHERVAADVTLAASSPTGDTNHPLTFTGSVTPNHAGERVFLQRQDGPSGDDWTTIGSATLDSSSNYTITHKFGQPDARDLRVLFKGDARNIRTVSNTVTVTIQQTQNPSFTINTSAPTIDEGSSAAISGNLFMAGSSTVPDPGVTVTLWSHEHGHAYTAGPSTITGVDGGYSFTVMPAHNVVYQVRTGTPVRKTAQLFEGVRDVVTLNSVPSTAVVGQTVTFSGSVAPPKVGHAIDLQRLGSDGDWHTVKQSKVAPGSTYSINWTFGSPGTKMFRVYIPGGPVNVAGHSPAVTITVTVPPPSSLPPAS
jgi:uncharacterized cupredoxin-like copper-binding protein